MPWKRQKGRTHNEWFRPVSRGNRKSCTNCRARLGPGESIWCCGAYVRVKWRNQFDCCKECWPGWAARLVAHERDCPEHCSINLVAYHTSLPDWMTLAAARTAPARTTDTTAKE